MAPVRTAKKSRDQSTRSSRPDNNAALRSLKADHEDDPDASDSASASIEQVTSIESSNEASRPRSQTEPQARKGTTTTSTRLHDLINDMVEAQDKRTTHRLQRVRSSYATSRDALRTSIGDVFTQHGGQAQEAHAAHIARLKELIAEKEAVEREMKSRVQRLRKAYLANAGALAKVLEFRAGELSGGGADGMGCSK